MIGTGWWCSNDGEHLTNPERKLLGDEQIRGAKFFDLWLQSVIRYTNPASVVVIDSRSPIKPDPKLMANVHWVELPFNARHSTNHVGQWSGWMRSVLMAGQYALNSDAEYFVYIEQDCLVEGFDIIEYCIMKMKTDFLFGSGVGTPQPIQQSFFIVRRRGLSRFIHNLTSLHSTDRKLSPEWKFVYSTWRPFVLASNLGLLRFNWIRRLVLLLATKLFYDHLPVGSGRARPLPLNSKFLYFQHGTSEELSAYIERNGFKSFGGSVF